MSRHDVILIGSGIGGLTAALHCAKKGRNVLVLEAAKQFGGFCNPFARKKFWFDSGIHYIGEMGEGASLRRHFERLEIYDEIGFRELNPDGFDRYVFPDYEVRMPKGADRFRDRLKADFPQERVGIDKFFDLLAQMEQVIRVASKIKGPSSAMKLLPHASTIWKYRKATFNDILDDCVQDIRLRAALSGPGGDIGLPPGKASGFMMLGLLSHFLGGAYFPKGGTKAVRDAYVGALKANGATLMRNTPVAAILTNAGKVSGVRTHKGEEFYADTVISNADAAFTYGTLLGVEHLSRRMKKKVEGTTQSLASLCAFIGTDLNPEDSGVDDANIWSYPSYDIDALYQPALDGKLGTELPFFLTSPTLKDPGGTHAPEGKHTVELITFAAYEPFAKWKDQKVMKRDQEYKDLKKRLGDALIQRAEAYIPNLSQHMEVCEISTPLTNISFANVPQGAIYGPEHSPEQFGPWRYRAKGPVDGLYLCGSSVMGGGIGTCVASGMMAARMAMADEKRKPGVVRSVLASRPKMASVTAR